MRMIVPLLLAVIGLAGGVGAGLFLAPEAAPVAATEECTCPPGAQTVAARPAPEPIPEPDDGLGTGDDGSGTYEYVKLNNQFVVPVVKDGRVAALVVMSLSVEVLPGARDDVFRKEPKLRDIFLQVLFDHANAGGFDGNFTSGLNMAALRGSLLSSAQGVIGGKVVSDILIQDIARQDT